MKVYTDGSCIPNPGPGGWACVIVDCDEAVFDKEPPTKKKLRPGVNSVIVYVLSGSQPHSTNNQMELTAATEAVKLFPSKGVIRTDSQYVKKGITEWICRWKNNGWKTAKRQPVKNKSMWEALDSIYQFDRVELEWIKGHAGDKYNDIADEYAKKAARLQSQRKFITVEC